MVDTGCLCYAVFDQNLVRECKLPTKNIAPRSLWLADGKTTTKIMCMAGINLDIDGRWETLWGYVMKDLVYPLILGNPWMEQNNIVYYARRQCLRIWSRNYGIIVWSSGWYEKFLPTALQRRVSHVSINNVALRLKSYISRVLKENCERKNIIIGAISIRHDFAKALETKKEL